RHSSAWYKVPKMMPTMILTQRLRINRIRREARGFRKRRFQRWFRTATKASPVVALSHVASRTLRADFFTAILTGSQGAKRSGTRRSLAEHKCGSLLCGVSAPAHFETAGGLFTRREIPRRAAARTYDAARLASG